MIKALLTAALMLAPLAAQAETIMPDMTPDGDYLGVDIFMIDPGDPAVSGLGFRSSRVENTNNFYSFIDVAVTDFDFVISNLTNIGNFYISLGTSAPVYLDAVLNYNATVPDSPIDGSASQAIEYSLEALGAGQEDLPDGRFSDEVNDVLFQPGDFINLSLGWRVSDVQDLQFMLDAEPASVPLPATLPMALAALGGFGVMRRRRQRGEA